MAMSKAVVCSAARFCCTCHLYGLTKSGLSFRLPMTNTLAVPILLVKPPSMMQGYLDRDPDAPRLNPASCLALAFPPTPMLQAPTHADACTPGVNLGLQTSPAPTQSLAASQRQTFPSGPTQAASQLTVPGQTQPIDSVSAAPSRAGQTTQTAGRPAAPPLHILFSSRQQGSKGKPKGQLDRGSAALRFLIAELKQSAAGAGWLCYLLTCRCTFRGVAQQVTLTAVKAALSLSMHRSL